MQEAGAIVLAGGRSSRMGSPKAALDWHGSTLLARVCGLLGRAVDGPIVVVGAAGQPLPELPPDVEVVRDALPERGPLEGLRAGLAALAGRAAVAFASATDAPLLHPAVVRRVVGALADGGEIALPVVGGHRQTLAAAYRVDVLARLEELLAAGERRPAGLFERCDTVTLDELELLGDPELRRLDPELESLRNLNDPGEYARALELPAPEVTVRAPASAGERGSVSTVRVRAWTLGAACAACGLELDSGGIPVLNGQPVNRDPQLPLVPGDIVRIEHPG